MQSYLNGLPQISFTNKLSFISVSKHLLFTISQYQIVKNHFGVKDSISFTVEFILFKSKFICYSRAVFRYFWLLVEKYLMAES